MKPPRFITGRKPTYQRIVLTLGFCNSARIWTISSQSWHNPEDATEEPGQPCDNRNFEVNLSLINPDTEPVKAVAHRSMREQAEALIENADAYEVWTVIDGEQVAEVFPKVFNFVFRGGLHVHAIHARIRKPTVGYDVVMVSDRISASRGTVATLATRTEIILPIEMLKRVEEMGIDQPRKYQASAMSLDPYEEVIEAEKVRLSQFLLEVFGE